MSSKLAAFNKESLDKVKNHFSQIIFSCFSELQEELKVEASLSVSDFFKLLEKPPESPLGDYAFPCFSFARVFRKSPQMIAATLKEKLEAKKDPWLQKCEVAGAFLNLFMNQRLLAEELIPEVLSFKYFESQKLPSEANKAKVMVEYSQPNTHKEFHVGHGRNVSLGDSLCNLYEYFGFKVTRANYIGDEGTHVAKALWQIKELKPDLSKEGAVEAYGRCYIEANNKIKAANEEQKKVYEEVLSTILSNLEKKSGSDYDLWQKTRQDCMDEFHRIYKWFGVKFDHFFYESEVSEESQEIVDEFVEKGLFKESEGAIGIDMEDVKLGFFMARKSDGTTPYITKDLALARRKFEGFDIDHSLYVVGSEQKFHFQQLFEALKRMGFKQSNQCYHLSYGHVVKPEGKMSSRAGNVFTFKQLADIMGEETNKKLTKYEGEWSKEEIAETAHKLSVGAIKYSMLSADANREIIFNPDSWTSFEGNTGPYLLYSYARTASILRKSGLEFSADLDLSCLSELKEQLEFDILRAIYDFNQVVQQALESRKPSLLANHLYDLCKTFNKFYANLSVLKATDENEKKTRLILLKCFSLTLGEGFKLLGMQAVERM